MTDLAKITIEAKDDTKGAFQSVAGGIQGIGNMADSVQSKLAALGGFLGVAFTAAAINDLAKYRAELERMSVATGTTVESLSVIGQAAKLAGVDMGSVEAAMVKLTKGLSASNAETKDTARALAYLGVSGRDAAGNLRDPGVVMQEIAKALGPLADGSNKTAIALGLFGKSGAQMLPILKSMYENGELVAKVTTEQALQAKAYEQALVRLSAAQGTVGRLIYGEMIPTLTTLIQMITKASTSVDSLSSSVKGLAQSGELSGWAENLGGALTTAFEAVAIVVGNVSFVLKGIGREIGGLVAQLVALHTFDFSRFSAIGDEMKSDAKIARENFDAWEKSILKTREAYEAQLRLNKLIAQYGTDDQASRAARHGEVIPLPFRGTDHETKDKSNPLQSLLDMNAELKSQLELGRSLTTAEKELEKVRAGAYNRYGPDVRAAALSLSAENLQLEKQAKALGIDAQMREQVNKGLEAANALHEKAIALAIEIEDSVKSQISNGQFELEMIGKSQLEIAKLTEIRKIDLQVRKAMEALPMDEMGKIDMAAFDRILAMGEAAKAALPAYIEQSYQLKQQMNLWDSVATSAGNFFGDLVVNGRSAFDSLKQSLKSFAAEIISFFAKRYILQMIAGGALGAGGTAANAAGSLLTGGGGSLGGSLLSTGLSYAGSYLFGTGATVLGASGATIGAGVGSGMMLGGAAGEGAILAGTSGVIGSGGITASITAGLAAIPVWGWIAIAVLAAYAYFGGKGGGPKSGGSFQGNFDPSGALTGTNPTNLFGLTPGESTGNSAVESIATATAKSYYAFIKKLGGESQGLTFGLGYDTDPQGTAQNRVKGLVTDSSGRTLFHEWDREIGRDEKNIGPELQLTANRALLAALQNSKLPDDIAAIINSVAATGATQQEIDDIFKRAQALAEAHAIMKDLLESLGVAITTTVEPLKTVQDVLADQGRALIAFSRDSDLSSKSLTDLTIATAQYRANVTALIREYENAKTTIGTTISDTIRNLTFGTLDKQGQYDMLQGKANSLRAGLGTMTDPAMIVATIQKISALSSQAFGLLDPAAQKAQLADFIQGLKDAQTVADARLTALADKAAADANLVQAQIRQNIEDERETARINREAANTNLAAANTNRNTARDGINITVGDGGGGGGSGGTNEHGV